MTDSTQNPPPPEEPPRSSPPPPPPPASEPSAPPPPSYSEPPPASAPPPPPGYAGGGYEQGGYQPGMAPPPMPAAGLGQPADLMPRFLARLIDYVLLGIVLFIINILILGAIFASDGTGALGLTTSNYGYVALTAIINAAVYLGYFAFMESNRGQTVGKMALKLETRGPDGGRPTMEQAMRRNAFTALGIIALIPFIGGFIAWLAQLAALITIAVTINNNQATRQGWHDNFAGGTTVVKIG